MPNRKVVSCIAFFAFFNYLVIDLKAQVMATTPRYSEFKGVYNVDPSYCDVANGERVICNEAGLEPPSHAEVDAIAGKLESLNKQLASTNRILSYTLGFSDRTAIVTFLDPKLINESNLTLLKEILDSSAVHWRIVVMGVDDSSTIVIYPTAIVYPYDGNSRSIIDEIQSKLLNDLDTTDGVFERQLAFVKREVPRRVGLLRNRTHFEPVILAVFDSSRGDQGCFCVWILQEGYAHQSRSWVPLEAADNGFRGVCGGSQFDVTEEGVIVPFLEAGDKFKAALCALAYDKKETDCKITLTDPMDKKRVEKFDICSSVLNDAYVRYRLETDSIVITSKPR